MGPEANETLQFADKDHGVIYYCEDLVGKDMSGDDV